MNKENSIITIGSIALDTIYTKNDQREEILGGSASYFAFAASYFRKVSILGVVGSDFPRKYFFGAIFTSQITKIHYLRSISQL